MYKRHRFLFILLGIGIGILLTNILHSLNPILEYREYTEEEIVAKATDLGMIFLKDNIDTTPSKEKAVTDEDTSKIEEKVEVEFVIENGDSLEKISKGLEEARIIDEAEKFLNFAKEKGVDKKLRVGRYRLVTGLDYDTILSILMKLK